MTIELHGIVLHGYPRRARDERREGSGSSSTSSSTWRTSRRRGADAIEDAVDYREVVARVQAGLGRPRLPPARGVRGRDRRRARWPIAGDGRASGGAKAGGRARPPGRVRRCLGRPLEALAPGPATTRLRAPRTESHEGWVVGRAYVGLGANLGDRRATLDARPRAAGRAAGDRRRRGLDLPGDRPGRLSSTSTVATGPRPVSRLASSTSPWHGPSGWR